MGEFEPDLVISDILTLAPTLAAEVAGVPHATLIPHVYPVQEAGMPLYSLGFQPPRTPLGRVGWRATMPILGSGLRRGRDDLNRDRGRLGLAPLERFHGGISELLAVVATFPQLEYPRRWPENVRVSGPLFFELEGEDTAVPEGEGPLVVIAPSTSQDPECRLLRVALEALADEPVRVLATSNRHRPEEPVEVPANAVLVPWMRYSQAFPAADVVVCHGGHGTVAGALAAGAPPLVWPAVGDQGESGARVAWSGAGLSLARRLLTPRGCGWRCGGCLGTGATWRGRRRSRPGLRTTTGPRTPPSWLRMPPETPRADLRRAAPNSSKKGSGGGTRTHNNSVNSRVLYKLSYPGSVIQCATHEGLRSAEPSGGWAGSDGTGLDLGMAIRAQQDALIASERFWLGARYAVPAQQKD